jgi:hypothetical protein
MSEDAVRIVVEDGADPRKRRPVPRWIAAATLLVVVGSLAVFSIVSRSDTSPTGASGEDLVVAFYLANDIDAEQLQLVTETLTTLPVVIDWRYVGKTEAYEEALIRYADNEEQLRILKENPDYAPASIRLLVASMTDMTAIRAVAFEMFPGPDRGLMGGESRRGTLRDTMFPGFIPIPRLPIEGGWVLESFNVSGVETAVEPGVNTVTVPWIEIGTALGGNTGCNGFHGSPDAYSFTDGVLIPGEVTVRAVGCDSPVEDAFIGMLWDHPDGIEVKFTGGGMVWTAGDTRLVFTSAYALAPLPDRPPGTMFVRLNCSPGVVLRQDVLGTGQDPEQLVRDASPNVLRVEAGRPSWWWGHDKDDDVVAAVTISDIRPVPYTIYTCADSTP